MAGFDFGRIKDVVSKVMDSDYIDIKRDIDGRLQEVYSNVPCHVAYSSVDNPDPLSVDVKPVIQSLSVHCQLYVDIRNNDFVVAKKMTSFGELVGVYSGRCGNPILSQGRKKFSVLMNATQPEEPTPVPPADGTFVKVMYLFGTERIRDDETLDVKAGEPLLVQPASVEGYTLSGCYVDGVIDDTVDAESPDLYIDNVTEGAHEVRFLYSMSESLAYYRFLVNGLYTKDDGGLTSGWHQYKKVRILSASYDNGVYTVVTDDEIFTHEDNGKVVSVSAGAKLVLYPGAVFVKVISYGRENNRVTFEAIPYEPTEKELSSYVCGWY